MVYIYPVAAVLAELLLIVPPDVPDLERVTDGAPFPVSSTAVGDLTGDGIPDIVGVGKPDATLIPGTIEPVAMVFAAGLGNGRFAPPVVLSYYDTLGGAGHYGQVHIVDVDGDGDNDVLVTDTSNFADSPFDGTSVWRNNLIPQPVAGAPPRLVKSTPPDGYIDPLTEDGGIKRVALLFDQPIRDAGGRLLDASNFSVTMTNNPPIAGEPPAVVINSMELSAGGRLVVLTLDHLVAPAGEWTTVTAQVRGWVGPETIVTVRFGHLPCDTDQNGEVTTSDAGAFGRAWRETPQPTELIDMDRSGVVTESDAGLFGALFKGRRGFRVWEGMSLPPMPE